MTIEEMQTMGSFGERLRREREMRGVSLDDIAEATKIGTRLLRALEEEHFELLPGGIFNKGFVRAYAKYLGLNEEEMVADYLQAAGESTPDPRVIAEQNAFRIDRSEADAVGSRMAGFPIIPVLMLLVVIAAGAGGWHVYQERMHERRARQDAQRTVGTSAPISTTPAAGAPGAPAENATQPGPAAAGQSETRSTAATGSGIATTQPGTQPAADLNAPAKTVGSPAGSGTNKPADNAMTAASTLAAATGLNPGAQQFEVTVKPRDKAWVSIKADGKITVRGIIGPPDVKTIRANDQIVFWTGNAGAVDVTFNGQPVSLSGGPNEVAVLVITPKGAAAAKPGTANHTQ
jgi:cytoskeleton protein RodZ